MRFLFKTLAQRLNSYKMRADIVMEILAYSLAFPVAYLHYLPFEVLSGGHILDGQ